MPTSSRTKASFQNPFDSSDDESTLSRSSSRFYIASSGRIPFDEVGKIHRSLSANPFDDDESKPQKISHKRQPTTNPFDEKALAKNEARFTNPRKIRGPTQSRMLLSDQKTRDLWIDSHNSSYGTKPGTSSSKNPFDSEEDLISRPNFGGQKFIKRAGVHQPYDKEPSARIILPSLNSTRYSVNSEVFKFHQPKSEENYMPQRKAVNPDHSRTMNPDHSRTSHHTFAKEKLSSISDRMAGRTHRLKQGTIGQLKATDNMNSLKKPKKIEYGESNSRDLLFHGGHADQRKQQHSFTRMQADSHMRSTGLDSQSVQELANYALHQSEDTTSTIYNCLKIAENTKEAAVKTTLQLQEQGEQIQRTHETAVEFDLHLSRGEKLLGSLGGLFSKPWKPKKTRNIAGPIIRSYSFRRKAYGFEQRASLGLTPEHSRNNMRRLSAGDRPKSQTQNLFELEKSKQDDALTDLSNVLGHLKEMTLDMGKEIERQNEDLDNLHDDVAELGFRVKGANERGRRLLGR